MECASSPLAATSPSAQLTNEQLQLPALCVSVSPCVSYPSVSYVTHPVLPLRVIRSSCVCFPCLCHSQVPLCLFVLNTQYVSFSIIFCHFAIFRSCLFHWLCSVSFESQAQERCSLAMCVVHRSCVSYTGAPPVRQNPTPQFLRPPPHHFWGHLL